MTGFCTTMKVPQQAFGKLYGKLEYRHFFADNAALTDLDAVVVGVGVKF